MECIEEHQYLIQLSQTKGFENQVYFVSFQDSKENAIDFINHKLKTSKDKSVNNYRVDYTGYEQDIGDWIRIHERHKERPVFVQFQDNQLIKITGEGSMFVLYEEDDEDPNESITVRHDNRPDEETFIPYHGGVDGLAGAGGRL